jgi:hypothetical protein
MVIPVAEPCSFNEAATDSAPSPTGEKNAIPAAMISQQIRRATTIDRFILRTSLVTEARLL